MAKIESQHGMTIPESNVIVAITRKIIIYVRDGVTNADALGITLTIDILKESRRS